MSNVAACLEDGYSSAGTAGPRPRRGDPAIAFRRHRLVARARHGRAGARRAGKASSEQAPSASDLGRRFHSQSRPRRLRRRLERVQHRQCPHPAGGRWTGPRAGGRGSLGRGRAAVSSLQRPYRHQPDRLHPWRTCVRRAAPPSRSRASTPQAKKIVFSGIGNVAGMIVSGGADQADGVDGRNRRASTPARSRPSTIRSSSGLVILYSDGLATSWTIDRYPNLAALHPSLIAAILYRDFTRHRDDATVLVAKW